MGFHNFPDDLTWTWPAAGGITSIPRFAGLRISSYRQVECELKFCWHLFIPVRTLARPWLNKTLTTGHERAGMTRSWCPGRAGMTSRPGRDDSIMMPLYWVRDSDPASVPQGPTLHPRAGPGTASSESPSPFQAAPRPAAFDGPGPAPHLVCTHSRSWLFVRPVLKLIIIIKI